jgi:hypothetical protein
MKQYSKVIFFLLIFRPSPYILFAGKKLLDSKISINFLLNLSPKNRPVTTYIFNPRKHANKVTKKLPTKIKINRKYKQTHYNLDNLFLITTNKKTCYPKSFSFTTNKNSVQRSIKLRKNYQKKTPS